jgi:hypothetical protein
MPAWVQQQLSKNKGASTPFVMFKEARLLIQSAKEIYEYVK